MVEQLYEEILDLIGESGCGLSEVVGVLEAIKNEILLENSLDDYDDKDGEASACG